MKDNFSSHASIYARFRPLYPPELYHFLLSLVTDKNLAWDCGCGNGQVAGVLADFFETVEATDISQKQLDEAVQKLNINYNLAAAEKSLLADNSVDLVTVGQAIHWFKFDEFYAEVNRVCKPDSVIAVWCYSLLVVNKEVDRLIKHLYADTLGEYWDEERNYVDEHYQTIPFPFKEIESSEFSIRVLWTYDHLIGYLNSWSAVQKYIRENNQNPIKKISSQLKQAWGDNENLDITFPLYIRVGRVKVF